MYIINSFSANMLSVLNDINVHFAEISLEEARSLAVGSQSAVGHVDTAAIFSSQLDMEIPVNRISISLSLGDQILVGQYQGPRLQEGATTLPEDATIVWCLVTIS